MNPDDLQESPQQAIEKYTTDFTKLAADGKLDPVIGRDEEIRRSIQVLGKPPLSKDWRIASYRAMYLKIC